MARELDFEKDNSIDVTNLDEEFRVLPSVYFGYRELSANASDTYETLKAEYKELRSAKYLEFRSREGKITESTLEAMLDTDAAVKDAHRAMLGAKRDYETIEGYVDSMEFKKDCLISLGANARKEL